MPLPLIVRPLSFGNLEDILLVKRSELDWLRDEFRLFLRRVPCLETDEREIHEIIDDPPYDLEHNMSTDDYSHFCLLRREILENERAIVGLWHEVQMALLRKGK